jgi:hypothetical protein
MSDQQGDNPLDSIPAFDRVSIRAVLVRQGQDPSAALAQAGIIDAVAIPVMLGDASGPSGQGLGNGITPNLIGVLEPDPMEHDAEASTDLVPSRQPQTEQPGEPGTVSLPAAYGLSPLAPVRPRRDRG